MLNHANSPNPRLRRAVWPGVALSILLGGCSVMPPVPQKVPPGEIAANERAAKARSRSLERAVGGINAEDRARMGEPLYRAQRRERRRAGWPARGHHRYRRLGAPSRGVATRRCTATRRHRADQCAPTEHPRARAKRAQSERPEQLQRSRNQCFARRVLRPA